MIMPVAQHRYFDVPREFVYMRGEDNAGELAPLTIPQALDLAGASVPPLPLVRSISFNALIVVVAILRRRAEPSGEPGDVLPVQQRVATHHQGTARQAPLCHLRYIGHIHLVVAPS
jgi:hypothetical protein